MVAAIGKKTAIRSSAVQLTTCHIAAWEGMVDFEIFGQRKNDGGSKKV